MTIASNFSAGRGFAPVSAENITTILNLGLRPPAVLSGDPSWTELQAPDYTRSILERKLAIPGRLSAGNFVHFGFTTHTPAALQLVTGYNGMEKRSNAEVIYVQTSTGRLDSLGIPHYFIDRHLLSPKATIALDHRSLKVDQKFLASRDFRQGRNAEFGAGLLTFGTLPPTAIEALVCADDGIRSRIAAAVGETHLGIRVVADPNAYFWPKK